ncbi:portal protein [Maritalea mediterranea]|uniref:Portal protein n=1 Tax=Maritalea mediterranea TaxID=2909667 RepID=A0ABS9EAK5_9HYPH|nr:portal protein [Maritalea mediterranea]MCF4099793.1 portal protein [Maritalea mediterranea]
MAKRNRKKKSGASPVEIEDVASEYERLEQQRNDFLDRARENAKLTIPSLFPPEGSTSASVRHKPYQSIGAHGVNTLTSKLLMTVLPVDAPVFRYSVSDEAVEDLANDPEQRARVEEQLNQVERTVQEEIESIGIRAGLAEALKHLIVGGNVLLYLPKDGNLKMYRLDRYVVQRDFEGNLLRVIIKETVAKETLSPSVRALIEAPIELPSDEAQDQAKESEVDVYTVFKRDGDSIVSYQTIKNIVLPRSKGRWPIKKSPVMPLRWNIIHGEDYGRSYIDEYYGDLAAADSLSKSLRAAAAAAAKVNPMVNPTGLTRANDVAEAGDLEVISGRAEDVTMLQLNKHADMQVAQAVLQDLIQRLSHAFMMNRSVQRDGERVTAEEIRAMISDIDDVLGGIYSLLAIELQYPLVVRVIDRMERKKMIPKLSSIKGADGKPVTTPKVVTGVEALGRGHDFNKYMTALREVIVPLGEQALGEINVSDFIKRAFVSLSIDPDGLLKSAQQKSSENEQNAESQQQAAMQEMLQSAVKGAAPPAAKAMVEGMVANGQPPE